MSTQALRWTGTFSLIFLCACATNPISQTTTAELADNNVVQEQDLIPPLFIDPIYEADEVGIRAPASGPAIRNVASVAKSPIDARRLVKRAEYNLRGESYQGEALMKVMRGGTARELRFKFLTLGDQASMVRILEPSKDKGITNLRKEFNLWQYLPKVNRVIRIPSSLMLQSWMGSDFSNDDVVKASSWVRDYDAKILEVNADGQAGIAKLELTPRKGAPIVWGKVHLLIRESDAAFLRQDFFKEDGTNIKTLTASKHTTINQRTLPLFYRMKNNENPDAETEISFEPKSLKVDRKLSPQFFSEAKMRDKSW